MDKFLTNYGKMYKDEMGQWVEGRGPGDPDYDEAIQKYTAFALGREPQAAGDNKESDNYDTDNYNDGIRWVTRNLDKGVSREDAKKVVKKYWGDLADKIIEDSGL